ncbi:MAG: DUF2155 domain-containing protein [Acidocella sp.]|nr:DUF2155 domain-containing protein [Acidocella sp.]
MRGRKAGLLAVLVAFGVSGWSLAMAQSMLGQASQGQAPQPALAPLAPVVVPPAPAITPAAPAGTAQPAPPVTPPPGLVQTPVPAANQDEGAPAPAPASANNNTAAANVPDVAPVIPNNWVPGQIAELGVLDKVDGSTSALKIAVGGQSQIGDLQVSVQACDTRPPDQIPDSAIFLTVSPAGAASGPPLFRGWMVRSVPAAAVVGDAAESFRVIGCG